MLFDHENDNDNTWIPVKPHNTCTRTHTEFIAAMC